MANIPNFIEGTAFGILNDFLSGFRSDDGYAQPNRYEVVIVAPPKLGATNENFLSGAERLADIDRINLRAQSIIMPGRAMNTIEDNNIYGPNREIVDGIVYADEIEVQFQSSSDLRERQFFQDWQSLMFNEQTWNMQYYSNYTAEMEIYILDKQDTRRYGVKLWEVYPKTVNPVPLSYGQNDELLITEIGFTFRYWTNLDQSKNPQKSFRDKALLTLINSGERNLTRNIPSVLNKLGRSL